jgi:hypothetical protein
LPFDWAQGGELVEPFDICDLLFPLYPDYDSIDFSKLAYSSQEKLVSLLVHLLLPGSW